MSSLNFDQSQSNDFRCGYCLQPVSDMVDPRVLNCSHVFCCECLQQDFRNGKKLECPFCKVVFEDVIVTSLPLYEVSQDDKHCSSNNELQKCDACKDEDAVYYCAQCDMKLCQQHQQGDELYWKTYKNIEHQYIDVREYNQNSHKYKRLYCTQHEDVELLSACSMCHHAFCHKCPIPLCQAEDQIHQMEEFSRVAEKLIEELKDYMKRLYDRGTSLVETEKKVQQQMSEIETKVDEMKKKVEEVIEIQIKKIQASRDEILSQLERYLTETRRKSEEITASLIADKDETDDLHKKLHHLSTRTADFEVIHQHKQMKRKADDTLNKRADDSQLPIKVLRTTSLLSHIKFHLNSPAPPTGLEFVKTLKSPDGKAYFSVSMLDNDHVICGRDRKVEIWDVIRGEVTHSTTVIGHAYNAKYNGTCVFVAHRTHDDDQLHITRYDKSLNNGEQIINIPYTTNRLTQIAVNTNYIVVVDCDKKILKMYSVDGDFIRDIVLNDNRKAYGVCLVDDGCVLVSDVSGGSVAKYKTNDTEDVMWKCAGLTSPSGLCLDNSRLIYVGSHVSQKISLLSPQGTKLDELTCDELRNTEIIYDITISGSCLYLACRREGVKRFTLTS